MATFTSEFTSEAVVNYDRAPHSVELREHTAEPPGDDDVVLAVDAVGVCGSDLHQWTSTHSWPVTYPVVLGHEFAGTVAAVLRQVCDRVHAYGDVAHGDVAHDDIAHDDIAHGDVHV